MSEQDPEFYKACLKVHGFTFDESDDGKSESDEESRRLKPPPVPYENFKDKIIKLNNNKKQSILTETQKKKLNEEFPKLGLNNKTNANKTANHISKINTLPFHSSDTNNVQENTRQYLKDSNNKPNTNIRPFNDHNRFIGINNNTNPLDTENSSSSLNVQRTHIYNNKPNTSIPSRNDHNRFVGINNTSNNTNPFDTEHPSSKFYIQRTHIYNNKPNTSIRPVNDYNRSMDINNTTINTNPFDTEYPSRNFNIQRTIPNETENDRLTVNIPNQRDLVFNNENSEVTLHQRNTVNKINNHKSNTSNDLPSQPNNLENGIHGISPLYHQNTVIQRQDNELTSTNNSDEDDDDALLYDVEDLCCCQIL